MTKNFFWKHFLIEIIGVLILSIGGSGIMKIGLGNSAYDAFSMSISLFSHIEVGTVATIINLSCVLVQMILLRKEYKPLYLLQILVSIVIGLVVNLFYYHIFACLVPHTYLESLIYFLFFVVINIIGVSFMVASSMIGLALESTCLVVAKKFHLKFTSIRFTIDIFFFCAVFLFWYFAKIPLTLREGTVILMLLFSPLVGLFAHFLRPIINAWVNE